MIPGGTSENISRFAGYLERLDDIARARLEYQDGVLRLPQDDYKATLPDNPYNPDIDELETSRTPNPIIAEHEEGATRYPHAYREHLHELAETDHIHGRPTALSKLTGPTGAGGGGGLGHVKEISVHYRSDGDQLQAELKQINLLNDNDFLLPKHGTDVVFLHDIDVGQTINDMLDAARSAVPHDFSIGVASTAALVDMVSAHDAKTAAEGHVDGEHSVILGRYVNGELVAADEEAPADPAPEIPASFPPDLDQGTGPGQWSELGGNEGINGGLIVDLTEASRTMIVFGNYFKTDAIVQTNSYIDNDKVETAAGHLTELLASGNKAENTADFVSEPAVYMDTTGMFSGFQWNVCVVDGNFYDVSLLYQQNYLCDNDVIVQDSSLSHYEVVAGANVQYNITNLFSGDFKYDVIIVGGSFHGFNFICQNNVLLDDDIVKIAAAGGVDPGQSVDAGDNVLTNKAAIVTYGDQVFLPLGEGMEDIAAALARGDATLDPAIFGDVIPGNGTGALNVLYVTGDYYDVNAVWQVNVFADADTAVQFLQGQNQVDQTPAQAASTGGNSLLNDAVIVDVGATNTFVDGDVYGDTILIQADLVSADNDQVTRTDPNQLVSELIAFTNSSEPEEEAPPLPIVVTHDDTFGHVLS